MRSLAEALIDTNVIVAAVTDGHPHHEPSAALLLNGLNGRWAVAAHVHAEVYNTLTKRSGPAPIGRSPADAWAIVRTVAEHTVLVGLSPDQTLTAIRRYAEAGGTGPRLYDALIAETALAAGVRRLVTWNVAHVRGLCPGLEVLTPVENRRG